ncbi:MAG: acetyltransferase [Acidiferrobacterales bacterium]
MAEELADRIEDGEKRRVAEAVKQACIEAALLAYEDAGISGLCQQGALENALDAIRMLDVRAVIDGLRER